MATPFFYCEDIGGRTIKQTILGGLSCGLLGTHLSFIVFGGFGLHVQTTEKPIWQACLQEGLLRLK